jgi:glycosyltransferase involved in cell wall biosynthesis
MQDLMAALVARRLLPFRLAWRSQGEKTVFSPEAPPDQRMRRFVRDVSAHVDVIVATTAWDAAALTRWGVPVERIRVEYLGVPDEFFRTTPRNNAVPTRVRLLLTGRLVAWKGHATLIRALGLLRDRLPNLEAWFAGEGDASYKEGLQHEIAQQRLTDRVRFLGHREDVPRLLGDADIAVHCSEREPFGLSIAEAMANRLPVIAAAVQGPREIIREGSGLLAAPGDADQYASAIARLVSNWPEAIAMGERGYEQARDRFRCAINVPRAERYLFVERVPCGCSS